MIQSNALPIKSASLYIRRPRQEAFISRHSLPSSNAFLAAFTARSTSASKASCTSKLKIQNSSSKISSHEINVFETFHLYPQIASRPAKSLMLRFLRPYLTYLKGLFRSMMAPVSSVSLQDQRSLASFHPTHIGARTASLLLSERIPIRCSNALPM